MTYADVLAQARTCIGPYCKACPVCNGLACQNSIPGPGAKGTGTVAVRNYQAWQEIRLNLDTICENRPVDTSFQLFASSFVTPFWPPLWGPCSCTMVPNMTTKPIIIF